MILIISKKYSADEFGGEGKDRKEATQATDAIMPLQPGEMRFGNLNCPHYNPSTDRERRAAHQPTRERARASQG